MEWKWTGAYSSHSYTFWVFFSVCFELHKNLLSKEKAWKVICVRGLFALCDLFFPGLSKLSGSIRYQVVLSLYIVQTISPSSHHRLFFFSLLLVWSFHFLFFFEEEQMTGHRNTLLCSCGFVYSNKPSFYVFYSWKPFYERVCVSEKYTRCSCSQ